MTGCRQTPPGTRPRAREETPVSDGPSPGRVHAGPPLNFLPPIPIAALYSQRLLDCPCGQDAVDVVLARRATLPEEHCWGCPYPHGYPQRRDQVYHSSSHAAHPPEDHRRARRGARSRKGSSPAQRGPADVRPYGAWVRDWIVRSRSGARLQVRGLCRIEAKGLSETSYHDGPLSQRRELCLGPARALG